MITLKQYLKKLQKMAEKHPERLSLPIVYSIDEEGNSFHYVEQGPTWGKWEVGEDEIHGICIN